jgi:hypothetical protein
VVLDDLFPGKTPADKKRATLVRNKKRGKAAEDLAKYRLELGGHEVERTGRGSDFRVRKVNPWTGNKGRARQLEVKSSKTAKKSPLQTKTRSSLRVVRPTFDD